MSCVIRPHPWNKNEKNPSKNRNRVLKKSNQIRSYVTGNVTNQ